MSTQADVPLCLLLVLAYWIEFKACWELALTAGELQMISSSYCTGCLESNTGSDICYLGTAHKVEYLLNQ
jgi:hypothetical protein